MILRKISFKNIKAQFCDDRNKLERILRVGFEVGGNILNQAWILAWDIQREINLIYEREFKNTFVIGLQLRFGDRSFGVIKDGFFLNETQDIQKFINCAQQIESSQSNINHFKWFIASDSQIELNKILKKYPNRAFALDNNFGRLEHSNSNRRSLIEVELLSKCNELILTGGSTFGWVAAMKMLKMPFYVNGYEGGETMKTCVRAKLSEPPKRPCNYGKMCEGHAVF